MIRKLLRPSLIAVVLILLELAAPALRGDTPQAAEPLYQIDKSVIPPEKISGLSPVYTGMAFLAKLEGRVSMEAIVNQHGDVESAKILKGLPLGLDQTALAAVKTWKFKPATKDGQPIKVSYVLTVNFRAESSSYGPAFKKIIEKHPDFEKALRGHRYQEATAILDHWTAERPQDTEIHLARSYVLLEQNRLSEAWQEASAYQGDPYEIFLRLGAAAWRRGYENRLLSAAARGELVELGLKAETKAMAARADALEPVVFKVLLLQDKFELTADPQERQAVYKEGSELQKRATALESKGKLATSEPPPH
ncbi:MAG TPA: energy transducer TonB [Thermoanaerobaculia bacterium]|jgi:TonB family protein|nr:energy transducer TonB [Thermoanaerobaculia bacterium]